MPSDPTSFAELAKHQKWASDIAARATAIDAMYNERITRQKEAIDRLLDRLRAHECSLNDSCDTCTAAGIGGGGA